MATAESADIGIYRVGWGGVEWNARNLTFQCHSFFNTANGHSVSASEIQ